MIDDEGTSGAGDERGLRERLSGQAEDAIGKLADDLLENPMVNSALQRAFGAREMMAQAQESAMEALNIPSASNLDKLARRLRSISQRLEEIEDGVERVDRRMEELGEAERPAANLEQRLDRIEARIDELGRDVAALRTGADAGEPLQSRAVVPEG